MRSDCDTWKRASTFVDVVSACSISRFFRLRSFASKHRKDDLARSMSFGQNLSQNRCHRCCCRTPSGPLSTRARVPDDNPCGVARITWPGPGQVASRSKTCLHSTSNFTNSTLLITYLHDSLYDTTNSNIADRTPPTPAHS